MSMDFAAYDAAAIAWVESQLPGVSAQFKHQAGGWQGKIRARLSFHASRSLGVDELRYELDGGLPAGEDYVPSVEGNRQFTLTILMQSRDQRADYTARNQLETLRTSLRKPSVQAAFKAAGLAFSTSEGIVPLDRWLDDRMESQAALDIHFNAVGIALDTAEAISYADKAGVEGALSTPAGADAGWADEDFGNT